MSIPEPDWLKVARLVLLSRHLDRLEVEQLTPQGKIKYQFSAGGHELGQVLLAQALDHPHDAAGVYYRSRPFLLANGLTPAEALAAGMARRDSPSQGRDVGVVFNLPRREAATVLPSSGDVGAQYTPAAGWAQAIRYRSSVMGEAAWKGALAAALGGDGSIASNGFWAALNIVSTLDLPLLFFIEDNGYGISVPSEYQTPRGNIAANLDGFACLRIVEAEGWQPLAAWKAIVEAVSHVRSGAGACLLRLSVPRLGGHTFVDTQAYKSPEKLALEASQDPLPHLHEFLLENGMSAAAWEGLEKDVQREIQDALQVAESSPEPDIETIRRHVFYEGHPPCQGGLRPEAAQLAMGVIQADRSGPRINMIDAVRRTLENEMELNPRLAVFGEDVGVKGGVHGATQDLQNRFGSERVFDTSLNEDGIIGRSVGMALAGLLPVPEIQFRKYADPAHEQINDLGTLRWRTANHFAAPVVVRIPVGYSKKTGDPWHSVTGEAVYAHATGWRIAFPSNAEDAVGLLRTALRGDDPTFFFEHRALLDTPEGRRAYPGHNFTLPFGQAARLYANEGTPSAAELTVVTWGAMVHRVLDAVSLIEKNSHPGRCIVLDLRTIIPWDREAVLESVHHTGKVLIVHEDGMTGGFGAEIAAVVAEQAFTDLDAPVCRVAVPDIPIPYNVAAMQAVLPNSANLVQAMQKLLNF